MPIATTMENGHFRIRVEGEMTIYTALELKQELTPCLNQASQVELDLSQVNEMDTAGLQLLMLLKRESGKRGVHLALIAHSTAVTDVIDTLNLATYFGDPIVLQDRYAT